MCKDADTDENQGSLGFEEFCSFYKMISTRRDLYLIMISYSNQKEFIDLHDLTRFLENEQKMRGLAREHLVDIVAKFEPCPENLQRMVLGIDGFTNYMRSPAGDIFNPEHNQVNQDMTQPLCNYYIATSHNTYLTGDQLLSQSRVEMYAYVLQAGCRCVEVDCWDGPDGEPIIHHGYTLTSKILFKDVIETINKYAFSKSQYPVILSIENHCTVPQQKKMAQYLREVLQDKLDLSNINVNECKKLPSPGSLKGKILVKGKKLPANLDPDAEEGDVSDDETDDEEVAEGDEDDYAQDMNYVTSANQPKIKRRFGRSFMRSFKRKRKKRVRVKNKPMSDGESEYSSSRERTQIVYHPKRRKTMRLSRALSDLVKYTKSVHVYDIETQAFTSSWQVSSLNETVVNQILQLKLCELVHFNQRQLLRVYPSNYRVDSSNFNPQPYWNAGCHMVAMNYQTEGRMLELNRAKFLSNGNCGYVLKPKCMCKGAFNPMLEDPPPGHTKTQVVLKIISGQQLPKPKDSMFGDRAEIIDPFVEVEIIGLPIDCNKQQTGVVNDNGFNPMWEETLVFDIHMPQIALVRFQVWDSDPIGRAFIGQRTIAFISMMPGYRHVYLEGTAESSIFVHVAISNVTGKVKSTNAVKAAIQKAAQKHIKGHKMQFSQDFPAPSSEEGQPLHNHKDLDSISQDSKNGEMSLLIEGPAAKAAIHKGAMSEPVRRAHKIKIHDPPKLRKGLLSRMSSTVSHSGVPVPCVTTYHSDLETSSHSSSPKSPSSESQNPFQVDMVTEPKSPQSNWYDQQNLNQAFELEPEQAGASEEILKESDPENSIVLDLEQPESSEETIKEPDPEENIAFDLEQLEATEALLKQTDSDEIIAQNFEQPEGSQKKEVEIHPDEIISLDFEQPGPSGKIPQEQELDQNFTHDPELPPKTQIQADSVPLPEFVTLLKIKSKFSPLIPPSSPARVRRTLEAPAVPRPSSPVRTKAHSRSCPRKQTTFPQTPMVKHNPVVHQQTEHTQHYSNYGYQVRPIPNGLCLSDSSSSSDGSTDSLEFVHSSVPPAGGERDGTLQREMKALFDQKMREIRCKSPLFF